MNRYEELAEIKKNWTPPPGLAGTGPRDVRLKAGGIVLAVLAAIFVIGGGVAWYFLSMKAQREAADAERLRAEGIPATATITRTWRSRDKDQKPMLSYEYEYNGRTYAREASAPKRIWDNLKEFTPIEIRLVPSKPENSHPSGWSRETMPLWLGSLIGVMFMLPGILFVVMIRRTMNLLSIGRAAPAIVTKLSRSKNGTSMTYEFAGLSGGVLKGRGSPTRKPATVGSTICVVYDPDKPSRNTSYPTDLADVARDW